MRGLTGDQQHMLLEEKQRFDWSTCHLLFIYLQTVKAPIGERINV